MKRMYKQPETDVLTVNTERMMDGATLSPGGPGDGNMEAPKQHSTALPVPGGAL